MESQLSRLLSRLQQEWMAYKIIWSPIASDSYHLVIKLPGRYDKLDLVLTEDGELKRSAYLDDPDFEDSKALPEIKTIQDVYDYLFGVD